MYMKTYILLSIVLSLFCIFKPTGPDIPDKPVPEVPGMVGIRAIGAVFLQGSTDDRASIDEKPRFLSSFSYNFAIDSTEVTLGEYFDVTGKVPLQYGSTDPENSTHPVCHVTWYDAVLFCNAKSKQQGYDTVYSYTTADTTASGSTYRLRGLSTDFTVEGYRLPTEAEWEFAAHGGSKDLYVWGNDEDTLLANKHSWWEGNSGDKTHPVALRAPNAFGLYDISGNAMEWVNDFIGTYPEKATTNFLGAADSPEDYRPVKGGCYRHTFKELRIPNRNDNYETMSSTTTAYIGFRCAFGTIDYGIYSINGNSASAMPPVRMSVTEIRNVLPTSKAYYVFVNRDGSRRSLCFIDFSVLNPSIVQFLDSLNVYYPVISPDGAYVAWCTKNEGSIDGSSVFVRALASGSSIIRLDDEPAFIPRWWIDPASSDTFLIYTTSAMINSSPDWPTAGTRMIHFSAGTFNGSPVPLTDDGGFHAGRSVDGSFLATGYDRLIMRDLQNDDTRVLFTGPENGKDDGDTSQVCNVSISPSDPPEVLFLDFGYSSVSSVVKRSYLTHEILFFSDYSNTVTNWIAAPENYIWSHPEWSNHPSFAAAGLEGGQSSAGIIDFTNKKYTELVSGNDLLHPFLWVGDTNSFNPADLAVDSVGMYNEPPAGVSQQMLSWKVPLFWKHYPSNEIFLVGSSRILNGIRPELFSAGTGLNLGVAGGDLKTSLELISSYILNHAEKTTCIVIEFNVDWLLFDIGAVSWATGFPQTKGYLYDLHHHFWKDSTPEGFLDFVEAAPNYRPKISDLTRGYIPRDDNNGWGGKNPECHKYVWNIDTINCVNNLAAIKAIGDTLAHKGIHCIFAIMPQSPYYREMGFFGLHGCPLETASAIISHVQSFSEENSYFQVYDAHKNGLHDYTDADASDHDHLSHTGATKFTHRLDSVMTAIMK